ncbi:hypothetical protein AC630_09035 [Bradyrhizobium sp. AS23.2]|nr:hypothetical protein AC630_09035 [Bradyrhizobium sp. AS23.2]
MLPHSSVRPLDRGCERPGDSCFDIIKRAASRSHAGLVALRRRPRRAPSSSFRPTRSLASALRSFDRQRASLEMVPAAPCYADKRISGTLNSNFFTPKSLWSSKRGEFSTK